MDLPPPYNADTKYPSSPVPSAPCAPIGFEQHQTPAPSSAPTFIIQQSNNATAPIQTPIVHVTFRHSPVCVTCPHCKNYGMTVVKTYPGCLAWLLCTVLCCVGFGFGCCLIPFCTDCSRSAKHFCSKCKRHIGSYSPM